MLSRVFTTDDTTIYPAWSFEEDGIVILFVPGVGEIRFTLDKAEEVADAMARQAEYGRWALMEKRQNEKSTNGGE